MESVALNCLSFYKPTAGLVAEKGHPLPPTPTIDRARFLAHGYLIVLLGF